MSIHTIPISTFDESQIAGEPEPNFDEGFEIFEDRFSRSRNVLFFLASRILGTTEGAKEAVQNCRTTASICAQAFEREGEFRSWIARILINEALAIKNHGTPEVFVGTASTNQTANRKAKSKHHPTI